MTLNTFLEQPKKEVLLKVVWFIFLRDKKEKNWDIINCIKSFFRNLNLMKADLPPQFLQNKRWILQYAIMKISDYIINNVVTLWFHNNSAGERNFCDNLASELGMQHYWKFLFF